MDEITITTAAALAIDASIERAKTLIEEYALSLIHISEPTRPY